MSARIQLTLVGSKPTVQHFVFTDPQRCTIGRAPECLVALPATLEYSDVSRRHCALRIDPPFVHVRDLGSLNGTFVNGQRLEGRRSRSGQETTNDSEWTPLHDGDELRLGQHTILVVEVREFVHEDVPVKDAVGSGTFTAFPD